MELDTKDTGLTKWGNTDSTREGIAGAERHLQTHGRGDHYEIIKGVRDWRKY